MSTNLKNVNKNNLKMFITTLIVACKKKGIIRNIHLKFFFALNLYLIKCLLLWKRIIERKAKKYKM